MTGYVDRQSFRAPYAVLRGFATAAEVEAKAREIGARILTVWDEPRRFGVRAIVVMPEDPKAAR